MKYLNQDKIRKHIFNILFLLTLFSCISANSIPEESKTIETAKHSEKPVNEAPSESEVRKELRNQTKGMMSSKPRSGFKKTYFKKTLKTTSIYEFQLVKLDFLRVNILNVINGSNSAKGITSVKIWVNDTLVLEPEKLNPQTNDISLGLNNLVIGNNQLKVELVNGPNTVIEIGLIGFMKPVNIMGAFHSKIPQGLRSTNYAPRILEFKIQEGIKARLLQSGSQKKIIDLDGLSLSTLNTLLKQLNIELLDQPDVGPIAGVDYWDQREQLLESNTNNEIANRNLFFRLTLKEDIDIWPIIDQLRKLPFIEEAYPQF